MSTPPDTLSHDGLPLTHWLLAVISPDPARSRKALETLQSMQMGLPSEETSPGKFDMSEIEAQRIRFHAEVERTVLDPAFPGADFIRALTALIRGQLDEHMRQNKIAMDRFDSVLHRLKSEPDTGSRSGRKRRLGKALWANTRQNDAATSAMLASTRAAELFRSLGSAILLAPDAIRLLMSDQHQRWIAMKALAAAGPKAAPEFLPDLLAIEDPSSDSSIMKALASVGGADPQVVTSACNSIQAALANVKPNETIPPEDSEAFHRAFYGKHSAWNAAAKLHQIGPLARSAPGVGPTVIPLLLQLSRSPRPGQRGAAAMALGACARGSAPAQVQAVVDRLLELTSDFSWIAGRAIDSLGNLAADPDRVIPRLIELLDQYVEFDPDENYNGTHSRIRHALLAFGPAARAAIPALTNAFETTAAEDYPEFPYEFIHTLKKLKADPLDLIPVLNRMRQIGNPPNPETHQEWQRSIDESLAALHQP